MHHRLLTKNRQTYAVNLPHELVKGLGWNKGDILSISMPAASSSLVITRVRPTDKSPPRTSH